MQAIDRLAWWKVLMTGLLLILLAQALGAQGSTALPKEARALMPGSATDITGTWAAMATSVHGKLSAAVRGKTACDEETSNGTIGITVDGSSMSHFVKMYEMAQKGEIETKVADSKETPEEAPGYTYVGPIKDETLPGGRIFYRELGMPCIESGTDHGRTETSLTGYARKGNFFFKFTITAPMRAADAKALAGEILANIQKIDLPLAQP